jgi:uncharacterized protein
MPIVSLYASILALLFVALSVRTLRLRRRLQIAIGDGDDQAMLRAMRVHANFAEYVPLGLLLIYFVETSAVAPLFVHLLGICLLAGRAAHAYGVSQLEEDYRFRVAGMAMTLATYIASAAFLLYSSASRIDA